VVLLYPFQRVVTTDIDSSRYVFHPTFLGSLPNIVPIGLAVLHGAFSKLPWPVDPSLLLHTIGIRPIVHGYRFEVSLGVPFLERRQCLLCSKLQETLHVWSALHTLLQLPVGIAAILLRVKPRPDIIFRILRWIIVSHEPGSGLHLGYTLFGFTLFANNVHNKLLTFILRRYIILKSTRDILLANRIATKLIIV